MASPSRPPLAPLNPNRFHKPQLLHPPTTSHRPHHSRLLKLSDQPSARCFHGSASNPKLCSHCDRSDCDNGCPGSTEDFRLIHSAGRGARNPRFHGGTEDQALRSYGYGGRDPNYESSECRSPKYNGGIYSCSDGGRNPSSDGRGYKKPNYVGGAYRSPKHNGSGANVKSCYIDDRAYGRCPCFDGAGALSPCYESHDDGDDDHHHTSIVDHDDQFLSFYGDDDVSTQSGFFSHEDTSSMDRSSKASSSSDGGDSSIDEISNEGPNEQNYERSIEQEHTIPHNLMPLQIPQPSSQGPCLDDIIDRAWHYNNVGEPLSPYTRITLRNHFSSSSSKSPKSPSSLWRKWLGNSRSPSCLWKKWLRLFHYSGVVGCTRYLLQVHLNINDNGCNLQPPITY